MSVEGRNDQRRERGVTLAVLSSSLGVSLIETAQGETKTAKNARNSKRVQRRGTSSLMCEIYRPRISRRCCAHGNGRLVDNQQFSVLIRRLGSEPE